AVQGEQFGDQREVGARAFPAVAGLGLVGQSLDRGGLSCHHAGQVLDVFAQPRQQGGGLVARRLVRRRGGLGYSRRGRGPPAGARLGRDGGAVGGVAVGVDSG